MKRRRWRVIAKRQYLEDLPHCQALHIPDDLWGADCHNDTNLTNTPSLMIEDMLDIVAARAFNLRITGYIIMIIEQGLNKTELTYSLCAKISACK